MIPWSVLPEPTPSKVELAMTPSTGGSGTNDTATYANASGAVTVNLASAITASGADGSDTLSGIENVTGSGNNDNLTGDGNANVINRRRR